MDIFNRKKLKFAIIGSVDDGKSTLIGRLLYDTKCIHDDQLNEIIKFNSFENMQLSLITDGLRIERENGITVDTAYRHFSTSKRSFIAIDCPGHFEYLKNMITGLSNVDTAILVIDAKNGVVDQTLRHILISSMLNIKNIIICINKMDLIDWDKNKFIFLCNKIQYFFNKINNLNIIFIPTCASDGDNIVYKSKKSDWYLGSTLLEYLENIELLTIDKFNNLRFIIQTNINSEHKDNYLAGKIIAGSIISNQKVAILPSKNIVTIDKIYYLNNELKKITDEKSCLISIKEKNDIKRNSILVDINNMPKTDKEFDALIFWFDKDFDIKNNFIIKQIVNETIGYIENIYYKYDIYNFNKVNTKYLNINDIAKIKIKTINNIVYDSYKDNKKMGSFILIDPITNNTLAGGVII